MMIDLKPYGAFIENTIRPLLEELSLLLSEIDKSHFLIDKHDLVECAKFLARKHITHLIIQSVTGILITAIICISLYLTYRS